jgi:hypothetical protein
MQQEQYKLLCTFVPKSQTEAFLTEVQERYHLPYRKLFVLDIGSPTEMVCTYSLDLNNTIQPPANTIAVHRKKHTRTLYTINALNELVKSLNDGKADPRYRIDWENYTDTLITTTQSTLKILKTKLHTIITF